MRYKTMLTALLAVLWLTTSLYTVDSRETAVVTAFGDPVRTVEEPGLKLKAPWPIHTLRRFDSRAHILELDATEAFTKDTKNLVLTPFVIWRISDARIFMETVKSKEGAALPLKDVAVSRIASSIGEVSFSDVLNTSSDTLELLPSGLLEKINSDTSRFGITVLDVRLRHIGLPVQNEQSIYDRMRTERSRIAKRYRSEGEEQASAIRAKADREAAEIRASAELAASEILSKAEESAAKLYAEVYAQDPALYELLRDIETSRATMQEGGTIVLDSTARPFSTLMENP
jgi:modulator of FtsH protease HflC